MAGTRLLFAAQTSKVPADAWAAIGEQKLKHLQLDIGPFHATGALRCAMYHRTSAAEAPVEIAVTEAAASGSAVTRRSDTGNAEAQALLVPTLVFAVNNVDDLSKPSCNVILDTVGNDIWSAIVSKQALRKPEMLIPAVLIVHCDLKRHRYRHRCAFPHLVGATSFMCTSCRQLDQVPGGGGVLQGATQHMPAGRAEPVLVTIPSDTDAAESQGGTSLEALSKLGGKWPPNLALAAPDPSPHDQVPGWPFRNYLAALAHMFPGETVQLLAMRARGGRFDAACSFLFTVTLPGVDSGWSGKDCPRIGGWEGGQLDRYRLSQGSFKWKEAQLADTLDPHTQAKQAMALNLDLMKWRAAPKLDLPAISRKRCLLLGCGTLGCEVARTLLAWGVQDLHLVDNGTVAFSNPVRQSLFTFDDCLEGGANKAEAAASMLMKVCPSVKVQASTLTIPMPGHPPAGIEVEQMLKDVEQLDSLVEAADVVFMLTDSRESRWLPSMLCATKGTLLINAALGFDSWIVMRHGAGPRADGERLGCYFCNDVVAPANSSAGRSLDEQCTVVRPGLARIAGATAVELFAALAQHPKWSEAPALEEAAAVAPMGHNDGSPALGGVPHMLRGCLTGFTQTHMRGVANERCSACSMAVVQKYESRGAPFVLQVTQEDDHLEVVSGLRELQLRSTSAPQASSSKSNHVDGSDDDWEAL